MKLSKMKSWKEKAIKNQYNKFLVVPIILILLFVTDGLAKPLKIGFIGDFTNVSGVYTHNMLKAAAMEVDRINSSGGLLGRKVELVYKNGDNDPQKHFDIVTEMILKDKVVAIFGGASSPPTLGASRAAKKHGVPFLVSIGNSRSIVVENGHPYVFLFEPNSWMETRGFGIFISIMPWRKYAWIGPDYIWGRNVLKSFKSQFKEIGVKIQWETETWHTLGNYDFKPIIKKIIDSRPEVLLVGTWGEDVERFVTQAKPMNLFNQMAVFGWFTFDVAGKSANLFPEGIWGLSRAPFTYLMEQYPQTRKFVDAFHRQYREYPNDFTLCLMDSLIAWQKSVKISATADPAIVSKTLKGLHFEGMRGKSYIRKIDGQMNAPVYFGRLVKTETYPFAVWSSVVMLPANKTWLTEQEITKIRRETLP